MKLAIFWLSYLWVPFVLVALLTALRAAQDQTRWLAIALIVLSLPLAWGRFVEPRLLLTVETRIPISGFAGATGQVRIALFADTHIGQFKNAHSIETLVARLETLSVDAVFLAGDILDDLPREDVHQAVAPLAKLSSPLFVVRGNHDIGAPGPDYGMVLWDALQDTGATLVENRSFDTEIGGQRFIVAGTSDLWQRDTAPRVRFETPDNVPVLFLSHNPDVALSVPAEVKYELLMAGHTHGGQIRVPYLTQYVIPTEYPFDTGLHVMPDGRRVFVTAGTGMGGLPIRFRRPPRIDVLTLDFDTAD
ncbi:MAG: metallophosphoesterase [Pseudomonadota bacterium]